MNAAYLSHHMRRQQIPNSKGSHREYRAAAPTANNRPKDHNTPREVKRSMTVNILISCLRRRKATKRTETLFIAIRSLRAPGPGFVQTKEKLFTWRCFAATCSTSQTTTRTNKKNEDNIRKRIAHLFRNLLRLLPHREWHRHRRRRHLVSKGAGKGVSHSMLTKGASIPDNTQQEKSGKKERHFWP